MTHDLGARLGVFGSLSYRSSSPTSSPYIQAHATASLNFQLSMLIYSTIAAVLSCCLAARHIGASCFAGSYTHQGHWFNYRGSFTFLK